jgi:hypothetical protein
MIEVFAQRMPRNASDQLADAVTGEWDKFITSSGGAP